MFVTNAFTLASALLGSVEDYSCLTERATSQNHAEEPEVCLESMALEWDGNRKALANAQVKGIYECQARKLDTLSASFKERKSELFQERDKWVVERMQLRTERDEKSSRYRDVLSSVCPMVLDSTSAVARSKSCWPSCNFFTGIVKKFWLRLTSHRRSLRIICVCASWSPKLRIKKLNVWLRLLSLTQACQC